MDKDKFFSEVDASYLIEENIRRVVGLEMLEARRFEAIYKSAMQDLLFKLNTKTKPGSFTEAHLKSVIAQLDAAMEGIRRRTHSEVNRTGKMLFRQGKNDTIEELNTFEKEFRGVLNPIPLDAIAYSFKRDNYLINNFIASLKTYDESVRATMERKLSESVLKRETYTQAAASLSGELFGMQNWRILRIARTELHGIYNNSKIYSFRSIKEKILPQLRKAVIIPMDARTADDSKYLASLRMVIDIDLPFSYKWRGKQRTFMAPPDRPNDRSILVPVNTEWIKN